MNAAARIETTFVETRDFTKVVISCSFSRHTRRVCPVLAWLVSWLAGRGTLLAFPGFPSGVINKALTAYSRGGGCGRGLLFGSAFPHSHFIPKCLASAGNRARCLCAVRVGCVKSEYDIRGSLRGQCAAVSDLNRNILWITRQFTTHPASASLTGRYPGGHGFDHQRITRTAPCALANCV